MSEPMSEPLIREAWRNASGDLDAFVKGLRTRGFEIRRLEAEAALAEERRRTVERAMASLPDDWVPWESDKADEAFGYNDALRRVREGLAALSDEAAGIREEGDR